MKNHKSIPAGLKLNLLRQICNLIPEFLGLSDAFRD